MGKETVRFSTLYVIYILLSPNPVVKHLKITVGYLTVTLEGHLSFIKEEYRVKLLMFVWQKQNLDQDLIIIKVQTGPIQKKPVKYHSRVFMNIMAIQS